MSLVRKTSKGTHYYRFMVNGKSFSGDTGTADEREAQRIEAKLKKEAKKSQTINELHKRQREHLVGDKKVLIKNAYAMYISGDRHYIPEAEREGIARSRWDNFTDWINHHYPKAQYVHEITEEMARGYMRRITEEGRWNTKGKTRQLATATRNDYLDVCKRIVREISPKAGVVDNPFGRIPVVRGKGRESRDIFTDQELELIYNNSEGWMHFIFMVGLHTGLRLGDICMLKWSSINMVGNTAWINKIRPRKTRKKTNIEIDIPILPALRSYLESLPHEEDQVYVFPELSSWYSHSSKVKIGVRFGEFLRGLGIQTHRRVEGRTKPVQNKDIHSLRHTFCYIAGVNKVPLSIVQEVMGHMTPEMTKLYNKHAQRSDTEKAMAKLSFLGPMTNNESGSTNPEALQKLMLVNNQATTTLNNVLTMIKSLNKDNVEALKPILVDLIQQGRSDGDEIVVEAIPPAQLTG